MTPLPPTLPAAAAALGVPADKLTVTDGEIGAPDGRSTSYWELADDALMDGDATGEYPPKDASAYRIVGTSTPRLDLPASTCPTRSPAGPATSTT